MAIRGDRIRRLREDRGLDQQQLAKRAGVHYSYIYRLENGENPNVSAVILSRIAKVLDTNTDYLVDESEVDSRPTTEDRPRLSVESEDLGRRLDHLDEKTRDTLMPVLSNFVLAAEKAADDARRRLLIEYDALPERQREVLLRTAEKLHEDKKLDPQVEPDRSRQAPESSSQNEHV